MNFFLCITFKAWQLFKENVKLIYLLLSFAFVFSPPQAPRKLLIFLSTKKKKKHEKNKKNFDENLKKILFVSRTNFPFFQLFFKEINFPVFAETL